LIETDPATLRLLEEGEEYLEGEYVKTPNPAELAAGEVNKENCYIDQITGAITVFAKVLKRFIAPVITDYSQTISSLADESLLKVIKPITFIDCKGEPTFAAKPFRYSARFAAGEYVRYRPTGGYDAEELEACVETQGNCSEVTENCRRLFERSLDLPRYFFVLKDFTPDTANLDMLLDEEVIVEVSKSIFSATYLAYVPSTRPVYPIDITDSLVKGDFIGSELDLVPGDTARVLGDYGEPRGLYEWRGSTWVYHAPDVPSFRDMFRFAPGDVASFRSLSEVRNYEATQHVTPLMDLEVYYDNGIFISSSSDKSVEWIDPEYRMEEVISYSHLGSTSFYRVIRSFTPPFEREMWNSSIVLASPRTEELFKNTLKFVNAVECSGAVTSRLKDGASTTKLGTCELNLVSKSTGSRSDVYVWEATDYSNQGPALSTSPETFSTYSPVDYGNGTLAL